jgi:hypothetical protein
MSKTKLLKVINSRLLRMFADLGPDAEYKERQPHTPAAL